MNKITNKVKEAIRFKSAIWKFDNADNEVAAAIADFYREYNDANDGDDDKDYGDDVDVNGDINDQ